MPNLGPNRNTNRRILQVAIDQIPSLDNLQVVGGSLYDNGFGKTLVIEPPKKKFKIVGIYEVCESDSNSDGSDVGDAVATKCCGTTAHYGVEVQPDGCGGWNEVSPELNRYVIYEGNRGVLPTGIIVEAEKGAKDEWLCFATSFGSGSGYDSSDSPLIPTNCVRVLADLVCEDGVTVKQFVYIPVLANVICQAPSDEPVS